MEWGLVKAIIILPGTVLVLVPALFLIAAEALLLGSWPLLVWMGVFFLGNAVYFPLVEEKSLAERFGQAYREYKQNVPRWRPRRRGWPPV
jgi:protein-S-isoprenylcysteine O-methyltransferase Ste14